MTIHDRPAPRRFRATSPWSPRAVALAAPALLALACAPAPTAAPAAPPASPASPSSPGSSASSALPASTTSDAAFARLASRFLAGYFELAPEQATIAGVHDRDGAWPDVSAAGDARARAFVAATRAEIATLDRSTLGMQARVDLGILENRLSFWMFALDELRELDWNPLAYTALLGDGIDPLLTRTFAPPAARMGSLRSRLLGVPAVLGVAKKRLAAPPRVHTETAIAQNAGMIALTTNGLATAMAPLDARERAELEAAAAKAKAALVDFQTFLEKDLLPRSTGDFRLGAKRLAAKLAFTLDDDVSPDDVVKAARALLADTQEAMVHTSLELWPSLMKGAAPSASTPAEKRALVRKVLARLADERSTNATIVADATRTLDEVTRFVREQDIVRVPDEPCTIIEMPEYRRGVAIAYCDSSGPLEKKQETFYAIAPTPRDWSAQRADSFYREYNQSMLADLTIHEAMPGHYLQAMHANRFKSDIRAVFSNGAFVEGWAVYGEAVMARHGYGGAKVRLEQQKMVLRLAANAVLDHEIHAGTMDEKAALALMTEEAFQEEGEAVAKWKRARLTSAQLTTYFYGYSEMAKLRADAERRPGFNERAYHDRLLGFGAPSFRGLRGLMAPTAN